ncbi:MAG TPA: EF-hand domain-containing protein [Candidatus Limnocylindria bacterium]|nr:EF-hand domain-containing protein [Candidatus Limnocylindria bacterium]
MKSKVLILTLALGASACFLTAQDGNPRPEGDRPPHREGGSGGERGPGGPGKMGSQRPPNPVIEALDLNHDGVIDADEIAQASASLKKLDKNGDGKLTPDELRPPRPAGPGGPGGPGGPDGQGRPEGPGGEGRPPRPAPGQ